MLQTEMRKILLILLKCLILTRSILNNIFCPKSYREGLICFLLSYSFVTFNGLNTSNIKCSDFQLKTTLYLKIYFDLNKKVKTS